MYDAMLISNYSMAPGIQKVDHNLKHKQRDAEVKKQTLLQLLVIPTSHAHHKADG